MAKYFLCVMMLCFAVVFLAIGYSSHRFLRRSGHNSSSAVASVAANGCVGGVQYAMYTAAVFAALMAIWVHQNPEF
jgi:hypothetical protein